MRNEILRMEHILCESPRGTHLKYLSMQVFEGEIFGILTLEQPGIDILVELMCRNTGITQGRVYYREKLVNKPGQSDGSENPVAVIGRYSRLFPDLTIADNLFTAQGFFRKYVIPVKMIRTEAKRHLKEAGLSIREDLLASSLTEYESIVVEILAAIIRGIRMIVLWDALRRLSVEELDSLGRLMRRWTQEGITFILVYGHHEVLRSVCDRIAVFKGETIQKIVSENEKLSELSKTIFAQSVYSRIHLMSRQRLPVSSKTVLSAVKLDGKYVKDISFEVLAGENVLFYGRSADVLDELGAALMGEGYLRSGSVNPPAKKDRSGPGSMQRVLLPRDPTRTLLFPELSAMENFCLPFADRINGFWMKKQLQRSVLNEYDALLGGTLQEPDLYRMNVTQLYDLLYLRYLLARPEVIICVQPLMETDMNLRSHILGLMQRLQESGIAILVLNTELYDTIYIANRLVQEQPGGGVLVYDREQFASIRKQQGSYYPD